MYIYSLAQLVTRTFIFFSSAAVAGPDPDPLLSLFNGLLATASGTTAADGSSEEETTTILERLCVAFDDASTIEPKFIVGVPEAGWPGVADAAVNK